MSMCRWLYACQEYQQRKFRGGVTKSARGIIQAGLRTIETSIPGLVEGRHRRSWETSSGEARAAPAALCRGGGGGGGHLQSPPRGINGALPSLDRPAARRGPALSLPHLLRRLRRTRGPRAQIVARGLQQPLQIGHPPPGPGRALPLLLLPHDAGGGVALALEPRGRRGAGLRPRAVRERPDLRRALAPALRQGLGRTAAGPGRRRCTGPAAARRRTPPPAPPAGRGGPSASRRRCSASPNCAFRGPRASSSFRRAAVRERRARVSSSYACSSGGRRRGPRRRRRRARRRGRVARGGPLGRLQSRGTGRDRRINGTADPPHYTGMPPAASSVCRLSPTPPQKKHIRTQLHTTKTTLLPSDLSQQRLPAGCGTHQSQSHCPTTHRRGWAQCRHWTRQKGSSRRSADNCRLRGTTRCGPWTLPPCTRSSTTAPRYTA